MKEKIKKKTFLLIYVTELLVEIHLKVPIIQSLHGELAIYIHLW